MKIDGTAAAYGLIQVVFADVTERLAGAVFILRRRREPNVTLEQIFRPGFKHILDEFKTELRQCEQTPLVDADDVAALQEACRQLAKLSVWRNDRIHARVRQGSDGFALYDWRTGKQLSISYEECDAIIQQLVKVIVTLEAYLPPVIRTLDFDKELMAFFKDQQETTEL
jgi:hypothetical protein